MSKTNIVAVLLIAAALAIGTAVYEFTSGTPERSHVAADMADATSAGQATGIAMSLGDLLARPPSHDDPRKSDGSAADTVAAPAVASEGPSYFELQLSHASSPERAPDAPDLALSASSPAGESVPVPTLSAASLTLDARFLLEAKGSARRQQIEAALQSFDDERFRSDSTTPLTAERYARLSEELRKIDPAFQLEWRETLLQNYPGLESMLPREPR